MNLGYSTSLCRRTARRTRVVQVVKPIPEDPYYMSQSSQRHRGASASRRALPTWTDWPPQDSHDTRRQAETSPQDSRGAKP